MIQAESGFQGDSVSQHYDDLDKWYRLLWGEHLHHGYYLSRRDDRHSAVLNLICAVAEEADLKPGMQVCDAGSGYGATARFLADRYRVEVAGFTVSQAQYRYAKRKYGGEGVSFACRDWMNNSLPVGSMDAVVAIESTEHMPGLAAIAAEARRLLRAGGRFVICAWLVPDATARWQERFLLKPICAEGRLAGLGSAREHIDALKSAGFEGVEFHDLSAAVARTWSDSLKNLSGHLIRHPRSARELSRKVNRSADFARSVARVRLAYALGCMRYGIFSAQAG